MNTTLKQAVSLITRQEDFKGNSLYAETIDNLYIVYSYGKHFPIAVYNSLEDTWLLNADKYSVSTSKHQSICRRAMGTYAAKLVGLNKLNQVIANKGN